MRSLKKNSLSFDDFDPTMVCKYNIEIIVVFFCFVSEKKRHFENGRHRETSNS